MENSGTIIWKDETVGRVTNVMSDMWYLAADWKPNHSDASSRFIDLASKLKGEDVIKEPSKGMVAHLQYDETSLRTTFWFYQLTTPGSSCAALAMN